MNHAGESPSGARRTRIPWQGWALAGAGPPLFAALNVWTRLHDPAGLAAGDRPWEPWVWEFSSAAMTLVLLPAIGAAVVAFGRSRRRAFLHLPAAVAFAAVHTGGFVILRLIAYGAAGRPYVFGGWESWLYEAPKDVATYAISAAVLWIAAAAARRGESVSGPVWLEVRDGARRYRLAPGDVAAAQASGNYVRLYLADGRRLFVRRTLAAIEAETGLLRVHRGWLVNPALVLSYSAREDASRRVELRGDVWAPLSPTRLPALRAAVAKAAA